MTTLLAVEVQVLPKGFYDHYPMIIKWEQGRVMQKPQFRYFNKWSLALDFNERVKNSWLGATRGRKLF